MKYTLLFSLVLATAHAGEHTVKEAPFEKSLNLDATFLPTSATVLRIEPKQWSSFVVEDLVDHGTSVKAGQALITCDREAFDEHLAEMQKGVEKRKIALAKSERELADLEISTPRDLEGARLSLERAKESLDHFNKVGRSLEEEGARERLKGAERGLSYVKEELKQLLKMYEEDGVTEETEEIILKRQRAAVKSAQFGLKRAQHSTAWTLEKTIPRKAVDLQRSFDAALLKYDTAKVNLPRTLEQKRLSVAKAKRDDAKADKKLAELEKDAALFTLKSPGDGVIYYGSINKGRWSPGSTAKYLFKNGNLPKKSALMTFVPANTSLALYGSVDQGQRLLLGVDNQATVTVSGLADQEFKAKVTQMAHTPSVGKKYAITLDADLPKDTPLVGGMSAKAKVITYRNEKALAIPSKAITKKDGKSFVKVKLADGKDESREVTVGKTSGDQTEILSGLAIDQVVLVP